MLLEIVTNEICNVRNIDIKKRYGSVGRKFYYNFIYNSHKDINIYKREVKVLRKFASMIDVPPSFVVGIMKLERIDDNGRFGNESQGFDRGLLLRKDKGRIV